MSSSTLNEKLFFFDSQHYRDLGDRLHDTYVSNQPYPHIVIDDFAPEAPLDDVVRDFPDPEGIEWQRFKSARETKLASNVYEQMPASARHLLSQLNSTTMCEFLERMTGIEGIIPDPHFWGGGLHQIESGGYLKVHADFNYHKKLKLDRRLNLLLYLNRDWPEEYGGHLELWDVDMKECVKKVLPVFNRCVVFSTTSTSYHGHPTPLTCPPDRRRRSLALYYYTVGRPDEERNEAHSTIFKERPGEELAEDERRSATELVKKLVPPILVDGARLVKRKLGGKNP